jgi:DNA-binding FrmR family transcriptional regulator
MNTSLQQEAIIRHISRLQGQLEGIKRELQQVNPDCEKTSKTLHAASRSFASVRQAFISCMLAKKFMKPGAAMTTEFTSLMDTIKG